MKQICWAMVALVIVIAGTGCQHGAHRWGCGACGHGDCGCPQGGEACGNGQCDQCPKCGHHGLLHGGCRHCGHGLLHRGPQTATIGGEPSGPPMGTVAYPYYTTRGPRDFYAANPPSIGP